MSDQNQFKLTADQLRHGVVDQEALRNIKKNPVYIIVDNVLDTYNIGSIFRLADAVAATKVILCQGSETPPHTRIKKASINTTEWVEWEYCENAREAIIKLKSEIPDIQIVAVELDKNSKPYDKIEYKAPFALVVGHESDGVLPETLAMCDEIAEIPMWGVNISMNVVVSLSVVLLEAMKSINR